MTTESPEVHPVHQGHSGHRWLDIILSITALVVSISSIVIAIHHGHIMEKMLQANSYPYVEGGFSDVTEEGKARFSFDLHNAGLGPADQRSLKFKVTGSNRYIHDLDEYQMLGVEPGEKKATMSGMITNSRKNRFIPARENQFIFMMPTNAENKEAYLQLEKARVKVTYEYCYCSVFDDCFKSDGGVPVKIERCEPDPANEFEPSYDRIGDSNNASKK